MLCRLFDDHKYMDIYLSICQEYSNLGKLKMSSYFSASTCEHLWCSLSHLVYHVVWALPSCFQWTRLCAIGWTIPSGSTRIEITIALPRSMEFESILLHFLHNTDTNMLCRLFDGPKYMDIYLPIHQEYCYREKSVCIFPHKLVTFTFTPCKLRKMFAHPSKDAANWSVWKVF